MPGREIETRVQFYIEMLNRVVDELYRVADEVKKEIENQQKTINGSGNQEPGT